jgi:predicted DNA-binding protein
MDQREKSGANAPYIKLTVRMPRAMYQKLHQRSVSTMAPHNKIVNKAVEVYLSVKVK